MLKSELSLEVSQALNPKVMRLFDTSHYCNNEVVENYLIEVLPVNKTTWITFHVQKGFSLVLNSSNLRYRKTDDYAGLVELPDGIYEFKQSFKPNIFTVQQYYHFRTTSLENVVKSERAKLIAEECKISKEDYVKNRESLNEIEEYAHAAKWLVEECLDKKKGIEMYKWAEKLLEYYKNACKC